MQLKRKEEFKPQFEDKPVEYKRSPPVDWSVYEIDYDAIIPHGKYTGSEVRSIRDSDQWYWDWMKANNIFGSWGLVKLRSNVPKTNNKQYFPFEASNGEVWLCIYAVEVESKH